MKDYLFCHIKNCGFKIGVDINATQEECQNAIDEFKAHLATHALNDLVDYLFNMIMIARGDSLKWEKEKELAP